MYGTQNAPEMFRLGAVPTDRLAGILPAPAQTYNVFVLQPVGTTLLIPA